MRCSTDSVTEVLVVRRKEDEFKYWNSAFLMGSRYYYIVTWSYHRIIPSTQSSMLAPRRSARTTRQINYNPEIIRTYPDGEPTTYFERKIAALNHQSFHSSTFTKVDDVLVYALFASKRRQRSYRACVPDTAFYDATTLISEEDGIKIRHIYGTHTSDARGLDGINEACQILIQEFPNIFDQNSLPVLQQ